MPANAAPAVILSKQVSRPRYFFLDPTEVRALPLAPSYGGFEQCDPDFVVQRKGFSFSTLELIVEGSGTVTMDGVVSSLRPGTLICYDRRSRLELRADARHPMAKYFLSFADRRASRRLAGAGLRPGSVTQLALFPEAQRVLEELIREGCHHRPTAARICAALAEILFLKIEELAHAAAAGSAAAEETFLRCRGVIESRAASLRSLGEITRAVGVEASHLCRLFRRYQGVSPYQFLVRRKMALAAERLLEPGCLVKEAAGHVGFTDPYHFSRCFRRVHGVAPQQLRRSLQRG